MEKTKKKISFLWHFNILLWCVVSVFFSIFQIHLFAIAYCYFNPRFLFRFYFIYFKICFVHFFYIFFFVEGNAVPIFQLKNSFNFSRAVLKYLFKWIRWIFFLLLVWRNISDFFVFFRKEYIVWKLFWKFDK